MSDLIISDGWSKLQEASRGECDAHVWLSDKYPGAPMTHVFTDVGAEVDQSAHGLPEPFATDVGLYYGGTLTPKEIQYRVDQHLGALGVQMTVE